MISKDYYLVLTLVIVATVMSVFSSSFYGNLSHDYAEQNRLLSQIADERAKKISEALEKERKQHAQIIARMQEELYNNKEEYERKIRALEEKKKKEVKTFVVTQGDDPKSMADSLSKTTGFKVYNE